MTVLEPVSVSVKIRPKTLGFKAAGQRKSFFITFKAHGKGNGEYVAGSYTWSDGVHFVRSPVVVSLA